MFVVSNTGGKGDALIRCSGASSFGYGWLPVCSLASSVRGRDESRDESRNEGRETKVGTKVETKMRTRMSSSRDRRIATCTTVSKDGFE